MARATMHVNRGGDAPNYWDEVEVPDDATLEQAAVVALTKLAQDLKGGAMRYDEGAQRGRLLLPESDSAGIGQSKQ
jgi:hypothetical protein